MKIKCEFCDNYISDTDKVCTQCGGENKHLREKAPGTPTTIEEFKNWYSTSGLPSEEVTRFFIGKNIQEAKAFGIYYDELTQNYIVYKNKADGSRAVRYEGKDEAFAVNELYMRLQDEIVNQNRAIDVGILSVKRSDNKESTTKRTNILLILLTLSRILLLTI